MVRNSLDNRASKVGLHDRAVLVDSERGAESESLLVGSQAAELFGQLRRKHWDGSLHQIHAGGSFPSIAVKGGVGFHWDQLTRPCFKAAVIKRTRLTEERDVGDVDTNGVCAISVVLDGQGVVEILRGGGIDSEYTVLAQILSHFEFPLWDANCQLTI